MFLADQRRTVFPLPRIDTRRSGRRSSAPKMISSEPTGHLNVRDLSLLLLIPGQIDTHAPPHPARFALFCLGLLPLSLLGIAIDVSRGISTLQLQTREIRVVRCHLLLVFAACRESIVCPVRALRRAGLPSDQMSPQHFQIFGRARAPCKLTVVAHRRASTGTAGTEVRLRSGCKPGR